VQDLLTGVDDADGHLGAAEVRPERRPHNCGARGELRGQEFRRAMGY
jgi:hypothetical protein